MTWNMKEAGGKVPARGTRTAYTNNLFERIIDRNNLNRAYKQVKRNNGSHGVDGMRVDELHQAGHIGRDISSRTRTEGRDTHKRVIDRLGVLT